MIKWRTSLVTKYQSFVATSSSSQSPIFPTQRRESHVSNSSKSVREHISEKKTLCRNYQSKISIAMYTHVCVKKNHVDHQ